MRPLNKALLFILLAMPGYASMLGKPNMALRLAVPVAGGTPITATLLHMGSVTTDGTVFATTGSFTVTANRLALAALACSDGTDPTEAPSSVTQGGLTWVKVANLNNEGGFRDLSVWRSMGAAPTTTTMTFTFGATKTGCIWAISEFANVDTSGTNGSGSIVQSTTTQTSPDTTALSATLAAFGSANNATYSAIQLNNNPAITPDTSFTELSDGLVATPNTRLETQFLATNDTTPNNTWTGSSSASKVAIEIKAGS